MISQTEDMEQDELDIQLIQMFEENIMSILLKWIQMDDLRIMSEEVFLKQL
jgi:hypothetical protein